MTPDQALNIAEDRVVAAGRAHLNGDPIDARALLEAAQLFHRATRSLQKCARWASGQRIGAGGIAHHDLSRILCAAANGLDWERMRDEALGARRKP